MSQLNKKEAVKMAAAVLDREKAEYLKRQNIVLKKMNTKAYTQSKENAMNNLMQAGIITDKGNLKKVYKG